MSVGVWVVGIGVRVVTIKQGDDDNGCDSGDSGKVAGVGLPSPRLEGS